mmetsp:Transcript_55501/g.125090  ORF Transcript_55501/g.125090 Transcript_55501/m.125090 type:complete len:312 (+) Transcript_55501:62-997(+)
MRRLARRAGPASSDGSVFDHDGPLVFDHDGPLLLPPLPHQSPLLLLLCGPLLLPLLLGFLAILLLPLLLLGLGVSRWLGCWLGRRLLFLALFPSLPGLLVARAGRARRGGLLATTRDGQEGLLFSRGRACAAPGQTARHDPLGNVPAPEHAHHGACVPLLGPGRARRHRAGRHVTRDYLVAGSSGHRLVVGELCSHAFWAWRVAAPAERPISKHQLVAFRARPVAGHAGLLRPALEVALLGQVLDTGCSMGVQRLLHPATTAERIPRPLDIMALGAAPVALAEGLFCPWPHRLWREELRKIHGHQWICSRR